MLQIFNPVSIFMSPLHPQESMISREGILYKRFYARSLRWNRRRRIEEADVDTPVAVDHCTSNCLEEALPCVRQRLRVTCLSSPVDVSFWGLLLCFWVVRFTSVHYFYPSGLHKYSVAKVEFPRQTKLASLRFHYATHELLLHDTKIPHHESWLLVNIIS